MAIMDIKWSLRELTGKINSVYVKIRATLKSTLKSSLLYLM
ncbi:hypothetical protein CLTEP_14010 [Clostridium tepidiprofundi DSM 19306]|uniref:Uncharacterized protein n=1 Tax=Clostridium tepidiprofundi DSM 19306 TaxID=1121338 RepID=A0A151B435_9CLOT|nr:hypothetical protein CLTEP_14010 [Clostridium tepidiprofundi DSM 19306]